MNDTHDAPRRLYRSKKDKVIGGVCGGLGGYLNIDPVAIRVVWLALILIGGTGLLAYLIAWILIPEAPEGKDPGAVERKKDNTKIVGIILIVVALIWLSSVIGWFHFGGFPWEWLAPLALVALGAALILRPGVHAAADKQDVASGTTPPPPPPPADTKSAEAAAPAGPAPAALPEPEASADDEKAKAEADSTAGDESESTSEPESEPEAKSEGEDEKKSDEDDKDTNRPFEGRLLRRSTSDRVVSGVCGGLAKYLKLDSTLIRLGWALLTVGSLGIGLFAYLAMMLAVPEEDD